MACKVFSRNLSPEDVKRNYERLLCQCCRNLAIHQLIKVNSPQLGIDNGLEWYANHIFDDHYAHKGEEEQQCAIAELKRIGYEIEVTPNRVNLYSWSAPQVKS